MGVLLEQEATIGSAQGQTIYRQEQPPTGKSPNQTAQHVSVLFSGLICIRHSVDFRLPGGRDSRSLHGDEVEHVAVRDLKVTWQPTL